MTSAAKRKLPDPIREAMPNASLAERVEALALEVFTAPADEAREAVARWKDVIDASLDARAERLRPKGEIGAIPAGTFRQMSWDGRAHGCLCKAAQEALKDA